jgi:hypothetical protein
VVIRAFPLALLLLVPALGTAQAPNAVSPPAASPTPRPAHRTVELDLVATAHDMPAVMTAPRSENFWAVLKNRAPSGSYRVTFDWVLAPTTTSRPPAAGLHSTSELAKPILVGRVSGFSPACDALEARAHAVLQTTDEREMPDRLTAYRSNVPEHGCPMLEALNREVDMFASAEIPRVFQVYEGDEVRYVVERLDPATKAVLNTWRFTVRAAPRLAWAYPTEEAWIVGQTSRDIVEMLLYVGSRSPPSAEELEFSVAADGPAPRIVGPGVARYTLSWTAPPGIAHRQALTFDTYIWSPASYEALATAMLQSGRRRAAAPSAEAAIVASLTNPRALVLAQESRRISHLLEHAMLDSGAHEQAALVLGALGLREAAGGFSDVRPTLCRMSAHLAVARALRGGAVSSTAGYADALLLTLVNREPEALARIDALERGGPKAGWASFLRALRIRNTRDWRILPNPNRATLLERLEQYRALKQSLGSARAAAFLETFPPEPIGDWGRIAFQNGASVELGQTFAGKVIALDINEAMEVWKALHGGKPLPPDALVDALNARPERLVSAEAAGMPQVIGWGTWARFFQRNVSFGTEASSAFLERALGLPDEAQQLRASLDDKLKGLESWPALLLQPAGARARPRTSTSEAADDRVRRDACGRGVALAQTAPERLSPHAWRFLDGECFEAQQSQALPPWSRWFGRPAPLGTALMNAERSLILRGLDLDARIVASELHRVAPFDPVFLSTLAPEGLVIDPSQENALARESVAALFGPLVDYDLSAMVHLAQLYRSDVAEFRTHYAKIVALEPNEYVALGEYLVDHGLDDEAADAYEKAIDKARERVGLSNDLAWLIGYYFDRSRSDRAGEVAKIAADVYSAGGLGAMAYYEERQGRYAEAEQWHRKIIDRYGEGSRLPLDQFYIRYEHRVGDGRFRAEAAAALGRVFPSGLERVSLAEMSAPPGPGDRLTISGRFARSTRFGLLKGDVVVALNGYRLRDDPQYQTLWTFDDRPEATAIVWRRGHYVEIQGRLPRLVYGPATPPRS